MESSLLLSKLLAAIMSLLDATNLRNRVYTQAARIEQLELAIEDIERINASDTAASEQRRLIAGIAANTKQ
jgi:hypothetical protein